MNAEVTIVLVALLAAVVNGAIGYGFSTLLVPVGLLFLKSRVLNPALVLAEVALNLVAVGINVDLRGGGGARVLKRGLPMMLACIPGVIIGGLLLKYVNPERLRLSTFVVLLPLVLLQAAGVRRPLSPEGRGERLVSLPVGLGVGVLYGCTTISGPPLALVLNNQGLSKNDFRAAISLFRVTESVATAIVYLSLSVYTPQSLRLSLYILPCIMLGVPLGRLLTRGMETETFRRVCMTFDAWLISFALSRALVSYGPVATRLRYLPMVAVLVLDTVILAAYFYRGRAARRAAAPVQLTEPAQ